MSTKGARAYPYGVVLLLSCVLMVLASVDAHADWEPDSQDLPPLDCEIWPEDCYGQIGEYGQGGTGCYRCVESIIVTPTGTTSTCQCWANFQFYPGSGETQRSQFTSEDCIAWDGTCFSYLA